MLIRPGAISRGMKDSYSFTLWRERQKEIQRTTYFVRGTGTDRQKNW